MEVLRWWGLIGSLGHWGCALQADYGGLAPSFLLVLLPGREVSAFAALCTLA